MLYSNPLIGQVRDEFEQIKTKNIAETAALMQVNQMIFNLDETTVK